MNRKLVLMRGGGDLGSAVAHKLFRSGFSVVIAEIASPLVVRRTVSYAQAVLDKRTVIEGVEAVYARDLEAVKNAISRACIPVVVDPRLEMIRYLEPYTVIDSTMAKQNRGMHAGLAPLTLALGPGFEAPKDVHAIIETKRGHDLGRIIYQGCAIPNTGIPGTVLGRGAERVLRAPGPGCVMHKRRIGDRVKQGDLICFVDDQPVTAPFDGMLRGLIMEGAMVKKGLKIGDVDPRSQKAYCYSFSDKARAVAGGVLEAVMHDLTQGKNQPPQPPLTCAAAPELEFIE